MLPRIGRIEWDGGPEEVRLHRSAEAVQVLVSPEQPRLFGQPETRLFEDFANCAGTRRLTALETAGRDLGPRLGMVTVIEDQEGGASFDVDGHSAANRHRSMIAAANGSTRFALFATRRRLRRLARLARRRHHCPRCDSALPVSRYLTVSLTQGSFLSIDCPDCQCRLRLHPSRTVATAAVLAAVVTLVVIVAIASSAGIPDLVGAFAGAVCGGLAGMLTLYGFSDVGIAVDGESPEPAAIRPAEGRPTAFAFDESLLLRRAAELEERHGYAAASKDVLLKDALFTTALAELDRSRRPIEELMRLARDGPVWVSKIALGVMAARDDVPESWRSTVMRRLPPASWDHAGLYLSSLNGIPGEVIGPCLSKVDQVLDADLVELIQTRIQDGREVFDVDRARTNVARSLRPEIEALVDEHGDELPESVTRALREWLHGQLDLGLEFASGVNVWSRPYLTQYVSLDAQRERVAAELSETLAGEPMASAIIIGETGVGKTTVIRKALSDAEQPWIAFEAGAASLNAGAMFVGQLEGRVEEIVQRLEGKRFCWIFPDFQDALFAGAYQNDPRGLLDALLLHVEHGRLRLIAEVTPAAYELLVSRRPRVASAFKALRLHPLDAQSTSDVCRSVAREDLALEMSEEAIRELVDYSSQFLSSLAQPGAALKLLKAAAAHVREKERAQIDGSDLLDTLSALTGIPTAILDPSRPLELDRVRSFLSDRVLGQPEAVETLVERIALVKAGLTDPTRPLGVFLFVGPTGTGKTELAKALAELVFGSPSRLVRLDMSEFQTPDSLERLLADANVEASASPLIAAVRRDPFAVVLLDEFEKAADPIHDLFLQLFDDGRLTDRSGQVCDFRHCLVIMTSNVGSAVRSGHGLGFGPDGELFRPTDVERALERAFRPEFLNRIDRVLVFRPFERDQMRALLDKEIDDVRRRRGLRDRPWAIELDESAIEFLIERGFSPRLGARPLKRAVEQHLLTPLARAIAESRVPTGDQFLFLSAKRGRIEVEFVGLDSDDRQLEPEVADDETAADEGAQLARIARRGLRRTDDRATLLSLLGRVEVQVDEEIRPRKESLLAEIRREGFWELPERHGVLAEIEYLDRLEAATKTASRLGERLRTAEATWALNDVGKLLAVRLHVLSEALAGLRADAPFEVFLRAQLASDSDGDSRAVAFLTRLGTMYRGWAERRGMRLDQLAEAPDEYLCRVSGLGAGSILADEAGLHVLEIVGGEGNGRPDVERVSVAVQVVGAPSGEDRSSPDLVRQARASLQQADVAGRVVRRYRLEPDGLVRDAVRGYRTGRVERVLGGDFDLYGGT